MCGVLAMLFIAVPALEIYLLITVGGYIGALPTLGIIVATGVCGAALARHQGMSALSEIQRSLATGTRVGRTLVEAALVLVAGVLLLTPGFMTDGVGFFLLVPWTRTLVAGWLVERYAARARRVVVMGDMGNMGNMGNMAGFARMRRDADPESDASDASDDPAARHPDDDHDPPPPGVIDV